MYNSASIVYSIVSLYMGGREGGAITSLEITLFKTKSLHNTVNITLFISAFMTVITSVQF